MCTLFGGRYSQDEIPQCLPPGTSGPNVIFDKSKSVAVLLAMCWDELSCLKSVRFQAL